MRILLRPSIKVLIVDECTKGHMSGNKKETIRLFVMEILILLLRSLYREVTIVKDTKIEIVKLKWQNFNREVRKLVDCEEKNVFICSADRLLK